MEPRRRDRTRTARRGTPRATAALFATAALAVLAGCGDDAPEGRLVGGPPDSATSYRDDPCSRQGAERRKIFHVTDAGFEPRRIVIRAGTPITFVNCGDEEHTVTKDSGRGPGFDSGPLEPGERFDRTFAYIGKQTIVDRRNRDARMEIEVAGLPGEPQK